jgi:hypothetical protein
MKALKILSIVALLTLLAGLAFNQWLLHRQWLALAHAPAPAAEVPGDTSETAAQRLRQAEERLNDARMQLQDAAQKLASANGQLAQLDQRLRQMEGGGRLTIRRPGGLVPADTIQIGGLEDTTRSAKRAWGPEQAAGEPDTHQAGDIFTAWAPRTQDGGEEWLKLDYENSVEVAEVRVRETHNPGAISKVTAFLADGSEVTLWEGTEPPSQPPVEMSFQVPATVNAKSVKVYLDTRRVPGWNEIDAVELIGRDGSRQWARQASASSTYAEQGGRNDGGRLLELEERLGR